MTEFYSIIFVIFGHNPFKYKFNYSFPKQYRIYHYFCPSKLSAFIMNNK